MCVMSIAAIYQSAGSASWGKGVGYFQPVAQSGGRLAESGLGDGFGE